MPRPDSASAPTALAGPHLPVELLRRYVAGQLPPAEEHAVEAHTLDCALCADVLEGLALQPAAATDTSLQRLRQRLHTRLSVPAPPRVVPLWAWRPMAAAAVLLLCLGTAVWLMLRRPEFDQRPEVAARTEATPVLPGPNLADAEVADASSEPAAVVPPAVAAAPARQPAAQTKAAARPRRPAAIRPANPSVAVADVAYVTPPGAAGVTQAIEAPIETATAASPTRMAAAPAAPVRTVRGRITDAAGQPLPGATVLVPGTTGTSTDTDGSFSLEIPAAASQLAVSSIGYTTQTRALLPNDSTLALTLAPNNKQLSEVVVVRRETPPMLPSVAAAPAGGYPALRKYLRDSLDYPQKALDERLEGTVRLRFVVGADGKLSEIEVVRKVSPECDEEAVRLLQAGPTWFPTVQNNRRVARRVVLDVPFKLEQR